MNGPAQNTTADGFVSPAGDSGQGPVVSTAPTNPVATAHKESEPISVVSPEAPVEYIKPSEVVEPEIHQEVAEAGVEAVSETPHVTQQHQAIGITPAKESVPVQTQPTGVVQLPQTQQEAMHLLKKERDPKNSWPWLLTWLIRRFKIAHQAERSVSEQKKAA